LAPEVIKHTTTKLALRQSDVPDRDTLAATMLFGPTDYEEIARLLTREAYLFTPGYHAACPIRTPDLVMPSPPGDEALRQMIGTKPWFLEAGLARSHEELDRLAAALDGQVRTMAGGRKEAQIILDRFHQATGRPSAPATRLVAVLRQLSGLKLRLGNALVQLERGPYRYLRGEPLASAAAITSLPAEFSGSVAALETRRQALADRFEKTIKPQATQLSEFLGRAIQRLRESSQPEEHNHEQVKA
ncbi:MAG: hypothetical protein ABSH20_17655, partial [Tepidisphaeraceae bacterium]